MTRWLKTRKFNSWGMGMISVWWKNKVKCKNLEIKEDLKLFHQVKELEVKEGSMKIRLYSQTSKHEKVSLLFSWILILNLETIGTH